MSSAAADRLRALHDAATAEVYLGNDDVQTNVVSREMALDAGMPEVEGQPFIESVPVYGVAWHVESHLAAPIIDAAPAFVALIEAAAALDEVDPDYCDNVYARNVVMPCGECYGCQLHTALASVTQALGGGE